MAHPEQRNFVEKIKNKYTVFFQDKKILDVGSYDFNGSLRDFFTDCHYTGIDLEAGPGVDIVCEAQKYDAPDETYDVVCSAECFEHNPHWLETFQNMIRMCKKNGLVFFTCATTGRAEHGTIKSSPESSQFTVNIGWGNYYRNLTEKDFRDSIDLDLHFKSYGFEVNPDSFDLYFWGIKTSEDEKTENSKRSIPVIGIPVVNGVHWLRRLLNSIDYPIDELFIVNNNGKGEIDKELDNIALTKHKYIKTIKVTHLPHNLGCSGAWNLIIKCYMKSPYWLIVNNDVAFTPGLLEKIQIEATSNKEAGMIHCNASRWGSVSGGAYDLFLIKDWVVQKVGLFDENLYPIYAEDVDYCIRLSNENIKFTNLNIKYLHGEKDYETSGSQTWRLDPTNDLRDKMTRGRILNETEYLYKKWGNDFYSNVPYRKPFNSEKYDSKYTTYDLNFVRQKHLGF